MDLAKDIGIWTGVNETQVRLFKYEYVKVFYEDYQGSTSLIILSDQ